MVSGYLPLVRVQYMYPYIKSLQCSEGETAGQIDLKLKFYHRLRGSLSSLVIFLHLVWFSYIMLKSLVGILLRDNGVMNNLQF